MNRTKTGISRIFAAGAVALMAACGGGGGGGGSGPGPTPAPAPGPAPAPAPPPVALQQRPVLFVVPTGTASSSYLPGYDTTISTFVQYLYRVVPDQNRAEQITRTSSSSFSSWHINALSSDDQVIVRHDRNQSDFNGRQNVFEYNPAEPHRQPVHPARREWFITRPAADGCSALIGDNYYYQSNVTFDVLSGQRGGDSYRYNVVTGQETLLQAFNAPVAPCFGHLMASEGQLWDVQHDSATARFTLHRRNADTGQATFVIGFTGDPAIHEPIVRFAVEGRYFYFAQRLRADGTIQIIRVDTSAPRPALEAVVQARFPEMGTLIRLDVDDGHVMLASQNGRVLMFDQATGRQQLLDLGVGIANITQVFVR